MIDRRHFLSIALAAAAARAGDVPTRKAKITPLFKSPDGHPNALEAGPDGLWIGEQVTDCAYLVDLEGRVRRKVETESSNTSGIAYGDKFLWMAANGKATGRPARPTDAKTGEILKVDPTTGKTLARHPVPGGGGVHGIEFVQGALWITSLKLQKLSLVDADDFHVMRQIPVQLSRAHGLAWETSGIWVVHTTNRVIHKLDTHNGELKEIITLAADDPDPHGFCRYRGRFYVCDAGIAPGGKSNESRWAGYVCRLEV